ncbi:MAG: acyltransferase family protein [Candidatus Heimdallarchaeota archaeon]
MEVNKRIPSPSFYLFSVDLLKGIGIILMIITHGMIWYDYQAVLTWDQGGVSLIWFFVVLIGLFLTFPLFLFVNGFNQINSFLRYSNSEKHGLARDRALKRGFIFLVIASLAQIVVAISYNPSNVLNYVLTWNFFHLFFFSSIFFLALFELVWKLERRGYNRQSFTIGILLASTLTLIGLFLLFHDYTVSREIPEYVDLTIPSILGYALIDFGTTPIFPWFSFSLVGALMASILEIIYLKPREKIYLRTLILLMLSIGFLCLGLWLLGTERIISTPMHFPASSSYVLTSLGVLILISLVFLFSFDTPTLFDSVTRYPRGKTLLTPIATLGKISLTIFFLHNLLFFIPPTFLPSEAWFFSLITLYSVLYILLSLIWEKRRFKYSLEWGIRKLSSINLRRHT